MYLKQLRNHLGGDEEGMEIESCDQQGGVQNGLIRLKERSVNAS